VVAPDQNPTSIRKANRRPHEANATTPGATLGNQPASRLAPAPISNDDPEDEGSGPDDEGVGPGGYAKNVEEGAGKTAAGPELDPEGGLAPETVEPGKPDEVPAADVEEETGGRGETMPEETLWGGGVNEGERNKLTMRTTASSRSRHSALWEEISRCADTLPDASTSRSDTCQTPCESRDTTPSTDLAGAVASRRLATRIRRSFSWIQADAPSPRTQCNEIASVGAPCPIEGEPASRTSGATSDKTRKPRRRAAYPTASGRRGQGGTPSP
jgi:hypothetical protein